MSDDELEELEDETRDRVVDMPTPDQAAAMEAVEPVMQGVYDDEALRIVARDSDLYEHRVNMRKAHVNPREVARKVLRTYLESVAVDHYKNRREAAKGGE